MDQVFPGYSAKVVNVTSWKACLVGILVLMLCVSGNESAQATAGNGLSDPYQVPVIVDTTGTVGPTTAEVDLEAVEAPVDIGNGVMAKAVTFNGTIPGPEFRLKVGDTVIVHFRNNLKTQETGIHWHGIELNNGADGSPVSQKQVKPGKTFNYKFTVTRPGIFWYHPHHHSSTNQVFKGLYGPLTVTDPHQLAGVLPSAAQTKTLVLSDITVCKAPGSNDLATFAASLPHVGPSGVMSGPNNGPSPYDLCEGSPLDNEGNFTGDVLQAGDVPNIVKLGPGPVGEGQTVLTNGVNVGARAGSPTNPLDLAAGARTLDVQPGQGLRLQVINAAATRYVRLHLTDNSGQTINLVRIGGQGGLLNQARVEGAVGGVAPNGFKVNHNPGEILIPPGGRADVVAAIPGSATGVLTLWTEDFQRTGAGFAWVPSVPAAHLKVAGAQVNPPYEISEGTALRSEPVEELVAGTGEFLNPPDGVAGIDPTSHPDITFTNTGGGPGINDIRADHDHSIRPDSARFAQIGDVLQIKVINKTGAHHPFHLHGFSFQPVSLTDTLPEDPGNGPNASPGIGPSYEFQYPEFVDEVDIPGGYTLTFLVRLDDRPDFYNDKGKVLKVKKKKTGVEPDGGGLGRWLFHCHILFHANLGMISELEVVE
ncbi:MAG: hypothetical protein Nkreftii_001668 [Candidatus Nitrospira kreftii]|uniref:Multicopper oxidase n=1 Tax=Candidatus Nitrospira kreftii TaxID=2652173 RepID=A0A7S8FDP7_9BACT|nr:MAG: hypothetical protein Nkreftii_001668 [Candidatus Nitrospira kreftii]